MVVAAFDEIFQVPFFFTCLEDGLQWLERNFDPDFVTFEEELLLGHVFFALGHNVSSDGPKARPAYYSGPVPTIAFKTLVFYLIPRRKVGF